MSSVGGFVPSGVIIQRPEADMQTCTWVDRILCRPDFHLFSLLAIKDGWVAFLASGNMPQLPSVQGVHIAGGLQRRLPMEAMTCLGLLQQHLHVCISHLPLASLAPPFLPLIHGAMHKTAARQGCQPSPHSQFQGQSSLIFPLHFYVTARRRQRRHTH